MHTAQSTESLLKDTLAQNSILAFPKHLPCAITRATLAGFDSARQLFPTAYFDYHIFPTLVKDLLHFLWNIDDLGDGNDFVESMDVAIKQFVIPKGIGLFPIQVQVNNVISMNHSTFSSQRGDVYHGSLKGSINGSSIVGLARAVTRAQKPVNFEFNDRFGIIVIGMKEFQDPSEVIWLSRRFTY